MTVGKRAFMKFEFGPEDESLYVPMPDSAAHGRVSVYGRLTGSAGAATLTVYGAFDSEDIDEIQTLNLGDISTGDTFKLTYSAVETTAITYSHNMEAAIEAALVALAAFAPGDVFVKKVSTTVYDVKFSGAFAATDVSAITITSPVGFTPVGVTETVKGGEVTEDITDTAALANAIVAVVVDQENKYPYLKLVFDGDADPDLAAAAYITVY